MSHSHKLFSLFVLFPLAGCSLVAEDRSFTLTFGAEGATEELTYNAVSCAKGELAASGVAADETRVDLWHSFDDEAEVPIAVQHDDELTFELEVDGDILPLTGGTVTVTEYSEDGPLVVLATVEGLTDGNVSLDGEIRCSEVLSPDEGGEGGDGDALDILF